MPQSARLSAGGGPNCYLGNAQMNWGGFPKYKKNKVSELVLLLQIPIGTCRGRELSHKVLCTEKVICINFEDLISLIQGGFFKLALARFF